VTGTFAPYIGLDEITDYDPARVVRVKKMIWRDEDQEFQTHYFVRILCETNSELENTTAWLQEQYGDSGYQRTWWPDPGRRGWIWMTEQLATFCRLKYRK
jgi:hypothetical protein